MRESEFTPGPWRLDLADVSRGNDYMISGQMQPTNGETEVALVYGGKGARTKANARLIAAAPALYAALADATRAMADDWAGNPVHDRAEVLSAARAALRDAVSPPQTVQDA